MSKLSKLLNHPKDFFRDFVNKPIKPNDTATQNKQLAPIKPVVKPTPIKPVVKPKPIKKIKTQQEYLDEISTFTFQFDVNLIKLGDEYIWPYLRSHFWVQLYMLGFHKNTEQLLPHRLQLGTQTNIKNYVRSKIKSKTRALEIDELSEMESAPVDFLFLTILNASEHVKLPDKSIYSKITDPIYEVACANGKALKLEFIKVNSPAISKCSEYKFKPVFLLPPAVVKTGFSYLINFHNMFFSLLKKSFASLKFTENDVLETINWELHSRDYYIQVLKKLRPKILFLNGFHYHAPIISAADSLGILTVDVQHGIQVGWNPLYNDWGELPESGYQSLPDVFWTWGEKEANSIDKVFKSNKHRSIIGGYPWLEKQLEYSNEIEKKYMKLFSSYDKIFLIALQNQARIPKIYKEMINKSPDDVLWVIRHHPKGYKFKEKDFILDESEVDEDVDVGSIVANRKNLLIGDYLDKVILARLFQVINVCISEGSTVATEADYFGVHNVILSQEGKNNYIEEIENGHFYFINSANEFFDVVNELDFSQRESKLNYFERKDLNEVLEQLLNLWEEKGK